jgi:c-di-GMP-binding flagellar brake protein YcgR
MTSVRQRKSRIEYYVFTQELEGNESKLGVPVAVYTLTSIIVHKGDTVTIQFYNTADEAEDRHTFTMQSPYKMDYDLASGQNKHILCKQYIEY